MLHRVPEFMKLTQIDLLWSWRWWWFHYLFICIICYFLIYKRISYSCLSYSNLIITSSCFRTVSPCCYRNKTCSRHFKRRKASYQCSATFSPRTIYFLSWKLYLNKLYEIFKFEKPLTVYNFFARKLSLSADFIFLLNFWISTYFSQ